MVLSLVILIPIFQGHITGSDLIVAIYLGIPMLIPFWLFSVFVNVLILKLTRKKKSDGFVWHLSTFIICMVTIAFFWSIGDIILSGYKREFLYYIKEFSFFIVFAPMYAITDFILFSGRLKSKVQ